jgi:enamine deaminase RidA (YjgF/YER057c/UK114 family)
MRSSEPKMTSLLVQPPSPEVFSARKRIGRQRNLTFKPFSGEGISDFCRRLARLLEDESVTPLLMMVYGRAEAHAAFCDAMRKCHGGFSWPLTWVDGVGAGGEPLAGVQVFGFTGNVERVSLGDGATGSIFHDGGLRHCLVGGLSPRRDANSRGQQTAVTLERLQAVLALGGFDFSDVIRTWFFLEDILSWYDEFNQVRTGIYSGVKFQTGSLPASTGVGAKNPNQSALTLAAWAVQSQEADAGAYEVASPLQCPAPAYGSSFSRAMEINSSSGRQLSISGTASIAPGGKTLWDGDPRRQVELTMDVVEAILRSRGFGFEDLNRVTAYFKHPQFAEAFKTWGRERQFDQDLVVSTHCAVCRDDLLFELEADAAVTFP